MNIEKLIGNTPMIKINYEYEGKQAVFMLNSNTTIIPEALKTELHIILSKKKEKTAP